MNESPRPLHVFARLPWVEVDFAPPPLGRQRSQYGQLRSPSLKRESVARGPRRTVNIVTAIRCATASCG